MGGSTNSLDSLSSPSPSPPPSLNKAESSVSASASTKQKSPEPAAGLDSDSELSELTEEEQDEKQKHKQKQKKSEIHSLGPGASRSSSSNRRGTASAMRGGSRRGGRKKRSTLVPAPMWGWAVYNAEQDTDKIHGGGENEGDDGKETVLISPSHISAPNPLDVLTSAALDAENSQTTFSRLKSDSQETEDDEKLIRVSEAKDVTVVVDGDIDMANSVIIDHTSVAANGLSSIASSRAPTPDSIASSRPSPPKDIPPVAYASTSRIPAGGSTTEDEDNTEIEEDQIEPVQQPKLLTTKSRSKPNFRIDASAQLPANGPSHPADFHSRSPQLSPPSAASVHSSITPSTTTITAANPKAKASRGGRGRGRGRGRARTRGTKSNIPSETDRNAVTDIIGDQVAASNVNIDVAPSKEDSLNIDVDSVDDTPRNFQAKLSNAVELQDEIMEPPEDSTPPPATSKIVVSLDADPSDKSDAELEPEFEVDVDPEVDAPSDVSDGEDEKEDELEEGEGEDEKDPDELEVDEEKEDEDKDDEDKEVSDKEHVEKDIDDDDRSEMNLEDEEEESDLQPAHRVEALDMLAIIELKFALLREKLYIEKMEELAWEESLVSSNEHPELIYIQSELLLRKNKRLELAERKCTFEIANITKRRRIDEDATWSSWKLQRDELQTDMIAENNRKRRKLERERRAVDRPQPVRRIPFSPSSDFLPPAPTLRQVVDSFPFTNSDQLLRNRRHNLPRKIQSTKLQVNNIPQNPIRGVNGISHGINAQPTLGMTVAYPELSTLSSSEAQGDLEILLSMTGVRRGGPASASLNTMGMNMNIVNMGTHVDTNLNANLPMYEQGVTAGFAPNHSPHGHVYASAPGINGFNSNRERLQASSSIMHGQGSARRVASGPGASSFPSSGPPQSNLLMGNVHQSQFAVVDLPPPLIGGEGGTESLPPSFGPNRAMGGGPGLKSGSAGGGIERERELRSAPTGSGGGGGRSTSHHGQPQHPLPGAYTANGVVSGLERQRDGDVNIVSSASSSIHGLHGRQVSSSAHFGPPGPGISAPLASGSRKRSLSPVGPGVGIGPNGVKGNGQWMGPGMGMAGFGTGHPGPRWEEEDYEHAREKMVHRDVRDTRGHERDRGRERDRDRDRDWDRDQQFVHQHRHLPEQQHARPQSAGSSTVGSNPHVHPHSNQAPHHHHVRPHHHHIVHHHHGPSANSNDTSPTAPHGPSLSPRMTRGEMFSERENGHGPPRAPAHRHPPTEVINITSSKPTSAYSHSSNRSTDDLPSEYRERERDGRRMSGSRPSSGSVPRIPDERERDRDIRERDRERARIGSAPFASVPNSQGRQLNGVATSSSTSSRPSSWNATHRDDPYRPESVHSSSIRRPSSSSASSSSPIHPRGSILSGPSPTAASGTSPMTITRALPPRATSPGIAPLLGVSPSGSAESRMRSPPRHRDATSQNQTSSSHNSVTKNPRISSPPPTSALVSSTVDPRVSLPNSLPMSTLAVTSSTTPEDIIKNGAAVKNVGTIIPPLVSVSSDLNPSHREIGSSPLKRPMEDRHP